MTDADIARFWTRVDRRSPDECWSWTGGVSSNGYAGFRIRERCFTASRVSWFIAHGRQPLGVVCHSCDNPKCVNPAHLWLGDNKANMQDKVRKGRWRVGATARTHPPETHCFHGHEYTPETTRYWGGGRVCVICQRAACERYRERRKAQLHTPSIAA